MSGWMLYQINPIDDKWDMLATAAETLKKLITTDDVEDGTSTVGISEEAYAFMHNYMFVLAEAKRRGWEGDFREELRVLWLPHEVEFAYAFVWKQDNNGDTFVASPVPMPWLLRMGIPMKPKGGE